MLISVIIPVYNEGRHIAQVVRHVLAAPVAPHTLEVIVSNDASTDDTLAGLAPYTDQIKLISAAKNEGKAAAIKRALPLVSGQAVIIQDADLEYSTADYPALMAPLAEGSAEVVYGSRFMKRRWPEGMMPAYWLANKVFTTTLNLLYSSRLTDEGTAYKVFRADLLRSLEIRSQGFEFCPEVTARILRRGIAIKEVPVSYNARSRAEGKKPGFMDGLRVLWAIVRFRFGR